MIHTERAILACCLFVPESVPVVLKDLKVGNFLGAKHQALFAIIKGRHEAGLPVDPEGIARHLMEEGNGSNLAVHEVVAIAHEFKEGTGWAGLNSAIQTLKARNPRKREGIEEAILLAEDFISLDIPPRGMIVSPWLTEQSMVLISGWRGVGKSHFGLCLLDAITKGESFGPWQTLKPVPCLYCDAEMPGPEVQDRLKLLSSSVNRKASLYIYSDAHANNLGIERASLLNRKWRQAMQDLLVGRGVKLWAIDNLASLTPNADENLKLGWDPINQWLIELRFLGLTTIMFHHTGRGGDQRGTSAREDNVDTSIILTRPHDYAPEDGARFILKFSKHRMRAEDRSLIADTEFQLREVEGRLVWTFAGTKRKNKAEILRMLADRYQQKDIAETLGISKGTVSKTRGWLVSHQYLTVGGAITSKGEDFLRETDGR